MAYRKLVPPRHVEEAMQHLQSTAQHATSSKRGLPRDVAHALERRSSTNQFALATDAKSLHQKQKSSARYVDIKFHP
ncbi:hypothetical protein SPRG_02528 [Saprolegnia parasitica CBS 223.65]|uniref:Uncharacterized protein n=1 Tax=Saprolegnia parasitica (strain CBS 223.65) TaxID=695850 RepID=A0A067CUA6_SAPPC|nr:hypothetical protein SPRG_02528 [Saprolegnia parasitica CBS 223.65]KDO32835.1 hypothetical protein SPRG_02528 [Saprolegnia parasitica CBS 223.65]|eukprot:XP_012196490.1 hypothetical protein SPRG_02528 [Saprolegnia parasitica CBS 223.65]